MFLGQRLEPGPRHGHRAARGLAEAPSTDPDVGDARRPPSRLATLDRVEPVPFPHRRAAAHNPISTKAPRSPAKAGAMRASAARNPRSPPCTCSGAGTTASLDPAPWGARLRRRLPLAQGVQAVGSLSAWASAAGGGAGRSGRASRCCWPPVGSRAGGRRRRRPAAGASVSTCHWRCRSRTAWIGRHRILRMRGAGARSGGAIAVQIATQVWRGRLSRAANRRPAWASKARRSPRATVNGGGRRLLGLKAAAAARRAAQSKAA